MLDWASEGEEVNQVTLLIDYGCLNFVGLVHQRVGFDLHVLLGFFLYQFYSLNDKLLGLLHKNPSGQVLKLFDWNKNTLKLFGPISNQYGLGPIHAFIALVFFSFFEITQITSLLKANFHFLRISR